MNAANDDNPLYDAQGQRIKPERKTAPLSEAAEALIKVELNSAVDQLRESNREQFKEISRDVANKWRILTILLALLTTVLGVSLGTVLHDIPEYVRKQLIEPKVDKTVSGIITRKSSGYIDDKLKPLETRLDAVRSEMQKATEDVRAKQNTLENTAATIHEQVRVQQLAIAARAGEKKAWDEIQDLSKRKDELGESAKAAAKDVEMFYDIDKGLLTYVTWVELPSRQNPGFSVDELLMEYYQRKDGRDGIVNTLLDTARDQPNSHQSIIRFLCENIEHEDSLKVIARMTRAISVITKKDFRPLDLQAVHDWWQSNKSDLRYNVDYQNLFKAVELMNKGESSDALPYVDKVIKGDPDALYARSIKCVILINLARLDEADIELNEISKRQSDYRWLLLWRGAWYVRKGEKDAAIESLNKAFERSPSLADFVRGNKAFELIETDPKIKWPTTPK